MFENYRLKRKTLRKNYRVVAEIKNNGIGEYLVEFKKSLITFDSLRFPIFNLLTRWEICHHWVSTQQKIVEGRPQDGWVESRYETKEKAYNFITQELDRCIIRYGSQVNKRQIIK